MGGAGLRTGEGRARRQLPASGPGVGKRLGPQRRLEASAERLYLRPWLLGLKESVLAAPRLGGGKKLDGVCRAAPPEGEHTPAIKAHEPALDIVAGSQQALRLV